MTERLSHPRPDVCPECKSPATKDDSRYFDCESYWLFVPGHLNQSHFCEVRVLRTNYAALQAKYNRLVEKCIVAFDDEFHVPRQIVTGELTCEILAFPDRDSAVKALEEPRESEEPRT